VPTRVNCYGPAGWLAARDAGGEAVGGAWEKVLRRPPRGDGFALIQLEAGVAWNLPAGSADRLLVLDGDAQISENGTEHEPTLARRGAYVDVSSALRLSTTSGALMLLISGEHLGSAVPNIWSPGGWREVGRGMWVRPLLTEVLDGDFEERVAGVVHIEPGGAVDLHHHRTAHLFLFLDGEADDEVIHLDGTREVFSRRCGDFVEYPYPVDHRSFSRTGCTILFVHEPISAAAPSA
jgi:hypothetical protein